jgi:DNA polymerase III delta subunit
MTLINHNKISSFFNSVENKANNQVFLVYGESYLIKQAIEKLTDLILGDNQSQFAMETLEGVSVPMGDIIEQVSTFSFLEPQKMVLVKNAPLFQTGSQSGEIIYKVSDLDLLSEFINKGLPENHFFIITTPKIDKRKKIFKVFEKHGLIIDCSIPGGVKKSDQDEQRSVLNKVAHQILEKRSKRIENQALNTLIDRIGFNLDLLSQNLDKLVAYSGNRTTIELPDIKAVVKRDKKDPVFNLTNAFMAKNAADTLFYLNSLFRERYHPLQILKSFENQVRKLLLVKSVANQLFTDKNINFKRMNFNSFKQMALPAIVKYDNSIKASVENREKLLSNDALKKAKVKPVDLLLAPNPKNAYPVFQMFQKSENFSLIELQHALIFLSDIDYQLKSSSFDARTKIENFIIKTCSKGGFVYAEKNKNSRHNI